MNTIRLAIERIDHDERIAKGRYIAKPAAHTPLQITPQFTREKLHDVAKMRVEEAKRATEAARVACCALPYDDDFKLNQALEEIEDAVNGLGDAASYIEQWFAPVRSA